MGRLRGPHATIPRMADPLAFAVLQRVPFLHEVPSTSLQEMAAGLPLEQVEPGEIIARQGQPARALLILIQGKAQAFRREAEAEPQPLGALVPGDLFGDLELVHERTFHADLVAAEACSVLVWERRALEAALKPWPRPLGRSWAGPAACCWPSAWAMDFGAGWTGATTTTWSPTGGRCGWRR